jgi:hypothetical protein
MTGELAAKRAERTAVAPVSAASAIEQILVKGDLKALSPEQRNTYYLRLCEMAGLNPLTQPFEYLSLSGKLVLYAKKACTDQLRAIHKISVVDMDQEEVEGIFSVTVKVQNGEGRTDMDIGSVTIAGKKGDDRANAIMKASTKAKRRATLSICGLGLLDETEIETIPGASAIPSPAPEAGETFPQPPASRPHTDRRSNVVINPKTGREIDTENARNQRPEWGRFTDKVQGFVEARDADGLKFWFTEATVAAWVAGWVFKDEAEEHFEAALDRIEELERA